MTIFFMTILNAPEPKYGAIERAGIKIVTAKQMLQRLAITQVKTGNTSKLTQWRQKNPLFIVSIKINPN